jgi:hypothetical protein
MSNAAPITNADVKALTIGNCIPNGYLYVLVSISVSKRALQADMPAGERLQILESLDCNDDAWLSREMVAAVEPMDDKGYQLVHEARKLDSGKILDVFAKHFETFAALNPSLIAALEMLPGWRGRARAAA